MTPRINTWHFCIILSIILNAFLLWTFSLDGAHFVRHVSSSLAAFWCQAPAPLWLWWRVCSHVDVGTLVSFQSIQLPHLSFKDTPMLWTGRHEINKSISSYLKKTQNQNIVLVIFTLHFCERVYCILAAIQMLCEDLVSRFLRHPAFMHELRSAAQQSTVVIEPVCVVNRVQEPISSRTQSQ